jgi:hypothetical protein
MKEGLGGTSTIAPTPTWFPQGNDLAVSTNKPNVAGGAMKGKP